MKRGFGIIFSVAVLIATGQLVLHNRGDAYPSADATVHVAPNRANASASGLSKTDPSTQRRILKDYGKLPLAFEKNQGQTDSRVKFISRGAGYTLFLTADEAVLSLATNKANGDLPRTDRRHEAQQSPIGRQVRINDSEQQTSSSIVRMKLVGATPHATVSGVDELPGKSNYFIGNDSKNWRSNIPTYAKVRYQGIYPGINLLYYGNHQQVEFDFAIAPGADPRRIQLDLRGTKRIRLDDDGDLVLKTDVGDDEIRWHKPVAYQEKNGIRHLVGAHYAITDENRVEFKVGEYDASKPLYIDPLIYSTYLGGSGDDRGFGVAVDSAGNAYVTGFTTSTDFPTMNPLQPANGGGTYDAFVTKINASGSALVYSTYLGGSGADQGGGIAVDSSGNAYVIGSTDSTNFPTMNPLQPDNGGLNAFVTKINASGSALVYSTYLGGSGGNGDYGYSIAVDSSGNAYVTGNTSSTNFPTMNPLQPTNGAVGNGGTAFVTKVNSAGSALVYSTYLGGSGEDEGLGVAVDSSGNTYVTGYTQSTNFPTMNPLQPANDINDLTTGGGTAFVAKINPAGSALVYSTYLGGSGCTDTTAGTGDLGYAIAVDGSGNAYVSGETCSTNFPTMNPLQPTYGGGAYDAFVTKINASGSALVYSTYLGGNGDDEGGGIAVDSSGNAYVTGQTSSTNFPTMNPLQPANGGSYNAYVAKISASGSALVYSTYLGGSGDDEGYGIAVDSSGNAYVTGATNSTNFPTMNPLQPNYGGGANDAFVAKVGASSAGTDFSLAAASGNNCPGGGNCSTSATVTAGQTATYDLQVAPVNGFNGTVTLSCDDVLAQSTCLVSPSSVAVNGTAASAFTVTVTTTAASLLGPQMKAPSVRPPAQIVLLSLVILILALFLASSSTESKRWKGRFVPSLALLLLGFVLLGGCGGGASGGGNNGGGGGNNGTPSGTVTVTGTSGGVSHSVSLTVNVN